MSKNKTDKDKIKKEIDDFPWLPGNDKRKAKEEIDKLPVEKRKGLFTKIFEGATNPHNWIAAAAVAYIQTKVEKPFDKYLLTFMSISFVEMSKHYSEVIHPEIMEILSSFNFDLDFDDSPEGIAEFVDKLPNSLRLGGKDRFI